MAELVGIPVKREDESYQSYSVRLYAHIRLLEIELDRYRTLIDKMDALDDELGDLKRRIRWFKSFHETYVERNIKD